MEDGKVFFANESEFQTSLDVDMEDLSCCAECSANFVAEARIFTDHISSVTEMERSRNILPYWLPNHKHEESSISSHQGTDSSEILRGLRKKWYQKCCSVHPNEFRQIYQTQMKMKCENFSPSIMGSCAWQELGLMEQSPVNSCESFCITSNSPSLICSVQNKPIPSSTQCPWSVMGSVDSTDNSTRNFLFENNASASHQGRKLEVDTTLALGRSVPSSEHENTASDKLSSAKEIIPCTKSSNRLFWQNAPSSPDSMSTSVGNDTFDRNAEMSNSRFRKLDQESLRILCKELEEKVKWQSRITRVIATTVLRCRSGMGRRQGDTVLKRDAWLLFLGPDKMGKRKIARALAEIVYGSEHKLSRIDINNFSSTDQKYQDFHALRGMKTLERIAELVRLDPHSVLLLEEIEQADTAVISGLVNAMETGKLLHSSGREVSISDAIIIMTSSLGTESPNTPGSWMYEDRLLSLMETSIKMLIISQDGTNTSPASCTSKASIVDCKQYSKLNPINDQQIGKWLCKRKADCVEESTTEKKIRKPSSRALDLNYSAEALESFVESCKRSSTLQDDCVLTAHELHVLHRVQEYFSNSFLKLIDNALVFQPFDFEQLEEWLVHELNNAFSKITGGNGYLQIDRALMDHFIAASSWQFSDQIFSKWLEDVFMDGLLKLLSIHKLSSATVIRLISVEKIEHSDSYLNSTLPTKFEF